MDREEYERLKEAEKEHLRSLKQLQQAARRLGRQKKITEALQQLTSASQHTLETHEELVERLARETAQQEARLEVALDAVRDDDEAEPDAPTEEELERIRAQQLVRQMKQQMGSLDLTEARPRPDASRRPAPDDDEAASPPTPGPLPEKTIGRMRP